MSFVSNSRRTAPLGRAGVVSLEFAFVALALFTLIMGVFDLARYFFTIQSMATLLTDFGRYSLIQQQLLPIGQQFSPFCPYTWPNTATSAPLLDPTRVTFCVNNWNVGVGQIQVTVTYSQFTFSSLLSFLPPQDLQEAANYAY